MTDCLFCKIVKKEIPSDIIFETDTLMAFKDINPQAPHHILIIPKNHITTVNDLDERDSELIGELVLAAKDLAKELEIAEPGYRLLFNCNADGGQDVFHIHLHLLGGRKMTWPPG
ncbi:MAG: histidine triad nucleotide-binding protein [Candidatus Marinimicrobia bacterium]|nr:histidine triad nucleotide-binding protein [Candidatus Neomarinimicrobiota bacterium]MBL7046249.1 histidine triad nucleotide-binding protein [Candidatus Neomarinimicrobiota bacterium]